MMPGMSVPNADPAAQLPDKLYGITEVLDQLPIGRTTLYNEIRLGRLKTRMVGRRRMIPASALQQWIDSLPDRPPAPIETLSPGGHPRQVVTATAPLNPGDGPVRLTAPLACPKCRYKFTGHWTEGRETADQQCRSCAHVFQAAWPGFTFKPETVIVRPDSHEHGDA
jgi:excisionase family DNA binding protein